MLELRNPHSVEAALRHRPQAVEVVQLSAGGGGPAWTRVAERARAAGVRVEQSRGGAARGPERGCERGGERGGEKSQREGMCIARVRAREALSLDALLDSVPSRGLWMALDRVQDPRNVGSIFRSAAFFGVRGMLLTRDQSAPLTGVTYDTASGGMEAVPFAHVTNLRKGLKQAQEAGLWVLGCAEEAKHTVDRIDRERAWLVVLGNEEQGLRRLTRESCDDLCAIPAAAGPDGSVGSLNVAVAAAVVLSHMAAGAPRAGS